MVCSNFIFYHRGNLPAYFKGEKKYSLRKICKFLEKLSGIKFEEGEIYRSMKNVEFNKLKEQENLIGFKEAPKLKNNKTIKFFYLGPNNNWKKLLKLETIKQIENSFKSEMEELGYL